MYQDTEATDAVDPATTLVDMAKFLDLETVLDLRDTQSPAQGDGGQQGSGSSVVRTPEEQAAKDAQDRNRFVQHKGNVNVKTNWAHISKHI